MAKTKARFVCEECGAVHMRWAGRCDACGEWNTISEEAVLPEPRRQRERPGLGDRDVSATPVTEAGLGEMRRLPAGMAECDRVLGGGLVPGSLTLVGGDPGIGKSTLMLQLSAAVARAEGRVLYVCGEESFDQTRLRAARLGALHDNLLLLTETEVELVQQHVLEGQYRLLVVDSIQSVHSANVPSVPGSVAQVRDCANLFMRLAKDRDVPTLLVGHVTKDGSIAGPRLLEHLVDTVLYFEGEDKQALRILRAVKNRFGSTQEIGVFEMTGGGLREVPNPSALFLSERPEGVSGSVVLPSVEGTRPLLVEVQALVGETPLGTPRRTVTGVNANRVSLLLAVLEKRAGLHIADRDVFVNVVGGVRLEEPAADLAIALALASSLRELPMPSHLAAFGEVGLSGEIRAVTMPGQRVAEAAKFGFARCLLPKSNAAGLEADGGEAMPVVNIEAAISMALER